MSDFVGELKEGIGFVINDEALLEDTIRGIQELAGTEFTEEEIREFLDENEMSTVVEAMYNAQTQEVYEIVNRMRAEKEEEDKECSK
jgi:Asp-tRNA(Asn)/Glu-tRNA(Gln) amidotransferase C subunit